jgi:uncharacterized protein YegP (UPF0339 family)
VTFNVFARRTLRGRRWFWHLTAGNGEIVASGQSVGYANKADVLAIIDKLQGSIADAKLVVRL